MATKVGELRETLIDAIEAVRTGKMDPDKAKAIAMLAQQVTSSMQVEINVIKEARALGIIKKAEDIGSLPLGETLRLVHGGG